MSWLPNQPTISVVMPVRNAAAFVSSAIESILQQSWQDFELIIVDDASTDETYTICETYAGRDQRIRLFRNETNLGVAKTANLALSHARANYIARMDGDDVSLPDRFAKQKAYLDANPDIVAVGGQCLLIDEKGEVTGTKRFPTNPKKARDMLYTGLPVQQPTIMLNRALLPVDFVYYVETDRPTGEEISLLFRLLQYGQIVALPDNVLQYRIHTGNLTLKHLKRGFYLTHATRKRAVKEFNYQPTWSASLISKLQWLIVSLIPESLIWQVYRFGRGMNRQPGQGRWWPPYLAVFAAFIIILLTNLPSWGSWLLGWDSLLPEMAPAANWQRLIHAGWQEYQGLGLLGGMAHGADLTRFIILWPLMLLLPASAIRYIWLFAMVLLGPLGVVKLLKRLLSNNNKKPISLTPGAANFLAAFGGLFYLFNLGTVQNFFFPLETFSSFYGFLPWLIWAFLRASQSKQPSRFLILFIINWLATSAFAVQTMFIVYAILLAFFAVREIFAARGKNLLSILIAGLIIIAVNFYWLLPVSIFTLTNVDATVQSRQNLISTPDSQTLNHVAGTPGNIFLLKGYWLDYEITDPLEKRPVHAFYVWRTHFDSPIVFTATTALAVFSVLGLTWALIRRRPFAITVFLLYLLTFVMLSAGNGIPGIIFNFVAQHIPLFGQIFRTTFTKWIALASLIYSLGLVFFLREVYAIFCRYHLSLPIHAAIGGTLVLHTLIICFPFFRHHLISHYMELPLSNTQREVFAYLKTVPVTHRGINLPFNNLWGWQSNSWGYMGSGFWWYGISQPMVDRNFDVWSNTNETMYTQLNLAVYQNDYQAIIALLEHYQITWLLFDKTIVLDNPSQMDKQLRLWRDVATIGSYTSVLSNEDYILYIKNDPVAIQAPLHLQQNIPPMWRTESNNYFALQGGYYTRPQNSQNYLFYPFSYLTSSDDLNQIKVSDYSSEQVQIDLPVVLPDDVITLQTVVMPGYQPGEIISTPIKTNFNGAQLLLDFAMQISLQDGETTLLTLPQLPTLNFDFSAYVPNASRSATSVAIGYNHQEKGPVVTLYDTMTYLDLQIGAPINLTFNLLDDDGELIAIIDESIPAEVWAGFTTEKIANLPGSVDQLHWRVITNRRTMDNEAINFVECQQRITGGAGHVGVASVDTNQDGNEGMEITVTGSGRACVQVLLGKYQSAADTLIDVRAHNERGTPLHFWVQDAIANSVLYESILDRSFIFSILDKDLLAQRREDSFYVLNINSPAYGEIAVNILEQINIYNLPLRYLSRLLLTDDLAASQIAISAPTFALPVQWQRYNPTHYQVTLNKPGILVLGQAYNQAWQAKVLGSKARPTHVLANGWANAWEITPEMFSDEDSLTIEIEFSIQKWITLGYLFWGLTFIATISFCLVQARKNNQFN